MRSRVRFSSDTRMRPLRFQIMRQGHRRQKQRLRGRGPPRRRHLADLCVHDRGQMMKLLIRRRAHHPDALPPDANLDRAAIRGHLAEATPLLWPGTQPVDFSAAVALAGPTRGLRHAVAVRDLLALAAIHGGVLTRDAGRGRRCGRRPYAQAVGTRASRQVLGERNQAARAHVHRELELARFDVSPAERLTEEGDEGDQPDGAAMA